MDQSIEYLLPATKPELRRRVIGLAWPVITENFLETLLGFVDTALVGALGASALAGVGTAQSALFLMIAILSALAIGNSVLVSQAYGARDMALAGRLARQSLVWGVLISLPLALLGVALSQPYSALYGLDAEAQRVSVAYLDITMGTIIVLVGLFVCSGVLRGVGDSRTPMLVAMLANIINGVLAYGLINGALGLPRMGAAGSAVAAFVGRAVALILLIAVLWRGRNGVSIHGVGWRPDLAVFKNVLAIGVPAALEQGITQLSLIATMIAIGNAMGTVVYAAQRVVMQITQFAFLPGAGFAIAATSLVGQAVGAKRLSDIAPIARIAAIWATVWMGAIGVLYGVFAGPAMRLFTSDPAVINVGVPSLRVAGAFFWLSLPLTFVYAGALRGTGESRAPMWVQIIGWWAATLGTVLALRSVSGIELSGLWLVYSLILPFMALWMLLRFRKRMRVLETAA